MENIDSGSCVVRIRSSFKEKHSLLQVVAGTTIFDKPNQVRDAHYERKFQVQSEFHQNFTLF